MKIPELDLTQNFPLSEQNWLKSVEPLLKGKSLESELCYTTLEDALLKPIYTQATSTSQAAPYLASGDWRIAETVAESDPRKFNQTLLQSLQSKESVLLVQIAEPHNNHPFHTCQNLKAALHGMEQSHKSIIVDAGFSAPALLAMLVASEAHKKFQGAILMDPLAELTVTGEIATSDFIRTMSEYANWTFENKVNIKTIGVDACNYHNAGADAAQELAFALATTVFYLRGILQHVRQQSPADIIARMQFSLGVGARFFIEIAKFRAFRILVDQAASAFDSNGIAQPIAICAKGTQLNKTVCDSHSNLLRSTIEGMAAALGGCDMLHLTSFDSLYRTPDDFSQRIARNIQLIMAEEAQLGRVQDPGSGSWFIEELTFELAQKAWSLFQKIEAQGGILQALQNGFIQAEIAKTVEKRRQNVAAGRDHIIGVTRYPVENEKWPAEDSCEKFSGVQSRRSASGNPLKTEAGKSFEQTMDALIEAAQQDASLDELTHGFSMQGEKIEILPLPTFRSAESLERNMKQ